MYPCESIVSLCIYLCEVGVKREEGGGEEEEDVWSAEKTRTTFRKWGISCIIHCGSLSFTIDHSHTLWHIRFSKLTTVIHF